MATRQWVICYRRADPTRLPHGHVLEDRDPLAESLRDQRHGGFPTDRVLTPLHHGIQPCRPTDGKTDEAMDTGRDREPPHHGWLVRPTAKDDAADCRAPTPPRRFYGPFAILATIESLDFPDIRLDTS